jgi:hypothetical protein
MPEKPELSNTGKKPAILFAFFQRRPNGRRFLFSGAA